MDFTIISSFLKTILSAIKQKIMLKKFQGTRIRKCVHHIIAVDQIKLNAKCIKTLSLVKSLRNKKKVIANYIKKRL